VSKLLAAPLLREFSEYLVSCHLLLQLLGLVGSNPTPHNVFLEKPRELLRSSNYEVTETNHCGRRLWNDCGPNNWSSNCGYARRGWIFWQTLHW